ncbi:MAG TPA: AMP-binding protein [Eoetvoesiella sp.]
MSSIDFLFHPAARGEQIAIASDTEDVSYSELITATNALAVALQTKDPVPGSNVGLCADNSASAIVAMLAIQAAGKKWIVLSPQSTQAEIYQTLEATLPTTILVDDSADNLINADSDVKILFSQFAGLVQTYFGQTPERFDNKHASPEQMNGALQESTGTEHQIVVQAPINHDIGIRITSCLAMGGRVEIKNAG